MPSVKAPVNRARQARYVGLVPVGGLPYLEEGGEIRGGDIMGMANGEGGGAGGARDRKREGTAQDGECGSEMWGGSFRACE